MSDAIFTNRRILVIDDNPAIHQDFRKILQAHADGNPEMEAVEAELFGDLLQEEAREVYFDVASAQTGQEGLAAVRAAIADRNPFAVAFVDVRMPVGWDGIETAARILKDDPFIQVVMCTAFSDYSWKEMIEQIGSSDRLLILKKPFDSVEVLQLAHALTEKWALHQTARSRMSELEALVQERAGALETANAQLKKEMAERARAEEALRQSQKMEALGQLAGGVAHDFNNLLTVIRGYAQCLLADGQLNSAVHDALAQIDGAAERAANLTSQMLVFSRKKRLQPEALDLNEVVAQLNKMLRRLLNEDIALTFEHSHEPLGIRADRAMIEQILLNLVVNARDAMPNGGLLSISTFQAQIDAASVQDHPNSRPGKYACLSVADSGCGISPEVLPRLFEPFYTTKQPGKGTGLGLATVYGIVNQHGGWIEVKTAVGKGARFNIYLPLCREPLVQTPADWNQGQLTGGDETILVVEDEEAVRNLAIKILSRHGYRILHASSGAEALSVWEAQGGVVDLLLTDMVMPDGVSGNALAQQLQRKKPGLKVVYTTGYSVEAFGLDHLVEGVNFLPKPYHPRRLVSTIRRCLDEVVEQPADALA